MAITALAVASSVRNVPAEYASVLAVLDRRVDFKANVLKVAVPRNDLHVRDAKVDLPPPFGFGGEAAMTKGITEGP